MNNQQIIRINQPAMTITPKCARPDVNRLLTPYCFGQASEREAQSVEGHLLECEKCWAEARRLDLAVRQLQTDPTLLNNLSAEEIVSTFGISGRIKAMLGGHLRHALFACFLYALLYAVALLVEVAYEYDRYRGSAIWVATGAFGWIFATSLAGLYVDWRLTLQGSTRALIAALGIFFLAAGLLFLALCLYLPSEPITQLSFQAYPAQAAYLKTMVYFLVLLAIFFVPPFHFILAMQRELRAGHHELSCRLLTDDRLSVAPRGSIYLRFWLLTLIMTILVGVSVFLHHNLMSQLMPGTYQGLFSNLLLVRLILFYVLGTWCLVWYYHSLDELKRECLAADRLRINRN